MTGGELSLVRMLLALGFLGTFGTQLAATGLDDGWSILAVAGLVSSAALFVGARTASSLGTCLLALVVPHVFTQALPGGDVALLFASLALMRLESSTSAPYLSWPMRGQVDPRGSGPPDATLLRSAHRWTAFLYLGMALLVLIPANRTRHLLPDWSTTALWTLRVSTSVAFASGALLLWKERLSRALWMLISALLVGLVVQAGPLALPGLIVLHVLAFDRAWLPPRRDGNEPALVFYDGHCGLCHRTVRMLLAEDPTGDTFRFAPLQGSTFPERVSERDELPDSVLVLTPDGRLLMRSAAAIEALWRLGGFWRALGHLLWLVPLPLRDLGYAGVAKVRKAIFGAPEATCPIIPADLGQRFLP